MSADAAVVCDAAAGPLASHLLLICAANLALGFAAGLYFANRPPTPGPACQPAKALASDHINLSASSSSTSTVSSNAPYPHHATALAPTPSTAPPDPDVLPDPAAGAHEPDVRNARAASARPRTRATLAQLLVYPVQSCAAVAVAHARVTAHGLEHDGRLVVVDFTGRPLTRAKHPALADVRPRVGAAGALRLCAPDGRAVEFDPCALGPRRDLCAGASTSGVDVGDAVADFFANYLEIAGVRVVRLDDADVCAAQGRAPFVLAAEPSRAHVARRVGADMQMECFRPNLVVDGDVAPFEEEAWKRIRVGGVEFDMAESAGASAASVTENEEAFKSRRESGSETPRSARRGSQRRRFGSVVQVGQAVVPDCGHAIAPSLGAAVEGALLRVGDSIEVLDAAEAHE